MSMKPTTSALVGAAATTVVAGVVILGLRRQMSKLEKRVKQLESSVCPSTNARVLEAKMPSSSRVVEDPCWQTKPEVAEGELVLYIHPICPFAQRAWIAAVEKLGEDGFRAIHIDLRRKPLWYKDVYDKQTVPALQYGPDFTMGDSIPCCEWIEKTFEGKGHQLFPSDPAEKKRILEFVDQVWQKIGRLSYRLLMNADPAKDAPIAKELADNQAWFEAELAKASTPFLCDKFGIFEVLICPFFSRFRHTLYYWRGYDMTGSYPLTAAWVKACEARPSIKSTLRPSAYYIDGYAGYAKGDRRGW